MDVYLAGVVYNCTVGFGYRAGDRRADIVGTLQWKAGMSWLRQMCALSARSRTEAASSNAKVSHFVTVAPTSGMRSQLNIAPSVSFCTGRRRHISCITQARHDILDVHVW
jgi:hypothetical protein